MADENKYIENISKDVRKAVYVVQETDPVRR